MNGKITSPRHTRPSPRCTTNSGSPSRSAPDTRPYHDRPFQVLHAERFSQALLDGISDPGLRDLPLTGAVDQFADNTDLLGDRSATRTVTAVLTAARSTPDA